jgi:hypothetical protein
VVNLADRERGRVALAGGAGAAAAARLDMSIAAGAGNLGWFRMGGWTGAQSSLRAVAAAGVRRALEVDISGRQLSGTPDSKGLNHRIMAPTDAAS